MLSGYRAAEQDGIARSSLGGALLISTLLAFLPHAEVLATVVVPDASGNVQILRAGSTTWEKITTGQILNSKDQIKTGSNARAEVVFEDSSKIEIGPNGAFTLEEAQPSNFSMRFGLGFMKAWVAKAISRRFTVKTPTAVCSVRGTEFQMMVLESGQTSVELFKGLLAVGDDKGNQILLNENEKVNVDQAGIGKVESVTPKETDASSQEAAKNAFKREVGLEMTKEQIQAAAALEQKQAIYQQGKALIDVFGNRVRLEEYIIRPQPEQFKLVVLNERLERFDYFFYLGTFNKTLPDDISIALRQIPGQIGAPPEYFLSRYEIGRSNTQDNIRELATGGHLVDVNNNGYTSDAVRQAFDPATNQFVSLSLPNPGGAGNQSFYKALFDGYSITYNGVMHQSWSFGGTPYNGAIAYVPSNATGVQRSDALTTNNLTNLIVPPNCATTANCTSGPTTGYPSPEPGLFHDTFYSQSPNGQAWDKIDNYVISDEGKVASLFDFATGTSGTAFKSTLLKWNFEQVFTASEFQGRKIDLVVEPKILIESGLVP